MTDTLSLFFTLLALLALAGTVGAWIVVATARSADEPTRLQLDLQRVALPAAWLVACVCMAGSLYYSEVAKFTPCALCWYQRICMYPLAVILGIAAFRKDLGIRVYVTTLTVIGAVIAAYHSYIQAFPPPGGSSFCTATAPCTERYVWELGFVSIPFMALSGFLFIMALMALAGVGPRAPEPDREVQPS